MPIPAVSIPVAIATVRGLLKYRARVDEILALKAAGEELPFLLPEAPAEDRPHREEMFRFFESASGAAVLRLHDLAADFDRFRSDPSNEGLFAVRKRLFRLFCEATGRVPAPAGPHEGVRQDRDIDPDMMLAYYAVRSRRLSKEPWYAQLLVATADVLLEVGGPSAGRFLADPRTRRIVESVLAQFLNADLQQQGSGERMIRSLMETVFLAATEHPGAAPDETGLEALFGTIAELARSEEFGMDGAAGLVSDEGMRLLVASLLKRGDGRPPVVEESLRSQRLLSGLTLRSAEVFPELRRDPGGLLRLMESGLAVWGTRVGTSEEPSSELAIELVGTVARELDRVRRDEGALRDLPSGEVLPMLARAALRTAAADPERVREMTGRDALASETVQQLIQLGADWDPQKRAPREALQSLFTAAMEAAGSEPSLLARDGGFVREVTSALFAAAEGPERRGFALEDSEQLVRAALGAAVENPRLAGMRATYPALLRDAARILIQVDSGQSDRDRVRREAMLALLRALPVNPVTWEKLHQGGLTGPLLGMAASRIGMRPEGLISASSWSELFERILLAVGRHGQRLVDGETDVDTLASMLDAAAERAERATGRGIDGGNVPAFLGEAFERFLRNPFSFGDDPERTLAFLDDVFEDFDVARGRV